MARPRIHPEGRSAAARQAQTRKALIESGGRVIQLHLSADGVRDLEAWRVASGAASDRAAIEGALAAALKTAIAV